MKSTLALVLATAAAVMAAPRPQETSVQIKASVFFTFTDASGVGNRDFQINVPVGASRLVEIDASNNPTTISGVSIDDVRRNDGRAREALNCSVFCDGNNVDAARIGVINLNSSFLDLATCTTISGLVCA